MLSANELADIFACVLEYEIMPLWSMVRGATANLNFLRTFALIVFAHPDYAHNSCRNVMPRHASSVRAEKTFQTNIGLVAVAITSLAVYFLKWSLTPNYFLIGSFVLRFLKDCTKMNKKSMWEVYQFLIFFAHAASNLAHLSTARRVQM